MENMESEESVLSESGTNKDELGNVFGDNYVKKWKASDIRNYQELLSVRSKIKNSVNVLGKSLMDLMTVKDILFVQHGKNMGSTFLGDVVVICSRVYLEFLTLISVLKSQNQVLFVGVDDENYDFVPFRFLMRSFKSLKKKYNDQSEELNKAKDQIELMKPQLSRLERVNEDLDKQNKELQKKLTSLNTNLESKVQNKTEKSLEDGLQSLKKVRKMKNRYEEDSMNVKDFVEKDMEAIKERLDDMLIVSETIISQSSDRMPQSSVSKLRNNQVSIRKIKRQIMSLGGSLKEMQSNMSEFMAKKILMTSQHLKNMQESHAKSLKMRDIKNSMRHFDDIMEKIKEAATILRGDCTEFEKEKRIGELMDCALQIRSTAHKTKSLLSPLANEASSEKKKKKSNRTMSISTKILKADYVHKEELNKLKLENFREIQNLNNLHQMEYLSLERQLFAEKRKSKRLEGKIRRLASSDNVATLDSKYIPKSIVDKLEKKQEPVLTPKKKDPGTEVKAKEFSFTNATPMNKGKGKKGGATLETAPVALPFSSNPPIAKISGMKGKKISKKSPFVKGFKKTPVVKKLPKLWEVTSGPSSGRSTGRNSSGRSSKRTDSGRRKDFKNIMIGGPGSSVGFTSLGLKFPDATKKK